MVWEILFPLSTQKNKILKDEEQVVYTISIKTNDMYFYQFHMIIRIQDVI